jgi:WD40 repeat protein
MADPLVIDAEHPWPWLEAFPEYAARFFNGRDDDANVLQRCVLAAPVTVLFGKSGLGKSSLLQAGLFPLLRKERLLPVYIRINHDLNAAPVSEQIAKRLQEETQQTAKLAFRSRLANNPDLSETPSDTLWVELHRTDIELSDSNNRRWQPLFVLDQFEEVFTLCAAYPERQKQVFYELGDLLENRIPKTLADRLHTDDDLFDRINIDTQPYRFLISLREDYLPDLEEWSDLIPRLGPNRYRLLPMSAVQATDAIEKTGGTLVAREDAVNIVNYLSQTQDSNGNETQRRRKQAQVEPALLSLMCSGLNAERIKNKKERLETANLANEGGVIIEDFYENAFKDFPEQTGETVRDFVEKHLITADGVRLTYPVSSIISEQLATKEQIQALVDKRLIRRENLEDGDRVELVHDRLAKIALQRRQLIQLRKDEKRKQNRRTLVAACAILLMLTLMGFAGFMTHAKKVAEHALLNNRTWHLVTEGTSMTLGLRPGGTIKGLFKILAGHRISISPDTYEALLSSILRFDRLIFLRENPDKLYSVAYSPNGKYIVSGDGYALHLWDANSGKPIGKPLIGHESIVTSLAFSPDSKLIASGSKDKTLRLWDIDSNKTIFVLRGHTSGISSVAFGMDGKRMVSGSWDNSIRLWSTTDGNPIGQPLKDKNQGEVISVAFSTNNKYIVSGGTDKTLRVWDVNTGKVIGKPLKGHEDWISSVAFSPDDKYIVSGSQDKTLRLWDFNSNEPVSKLLQGHEGRVSSVAFSPDGNTIVSGSTDDTLRLWETVTGQPIGKPFTGHTDSVFGVAFSPDGNRIVSVSSDKTLCVWDANTHQTVDEEFNGHEARVSSIAYSPDGKQIVSSSMDRTIRIWDAKTGHPISKPLIGIDSVFSAAINPTGKRIVSGGKDKALHLWDIATSQPAGEPLVGHNNWVYSVAFSPDGTRIVSGSGDKTLRLWDAGTSQPIGNPLIGHDDVILSVAISPDGKHVVSASADKTLRLWDLNTLKQIGQPLQGHDDVVLSVAFSPDGKYIVSGSRDLTIRLWDANTSQSIGQPLTGHTDSVYSVSFSPNNKYIVSGSSDSTLRLWDTITKQSIGLPLQWHKSGVRSVAFSPDGKSITSGGEDMKLHRWPMFESWVDTLCNKLGRNMSHKEWHEWVSPDIDYIEQCTGLPIPPDEPEARESAETKLSPP